MIVLKHECCCCCYASVVHTNSAHCSCMHVILSMVSFRFLFIYLHAYMCIATIFLEFLIQWTFQRFYFIDRILFSTEYVMSWKIFTPNEARKIIHEFELAFVAKRNTHIKATAIAHCDNSISSFADFHWSPLIFREISVLFAQWKVKAARLCSALCKSSIRWWDENAIRKAATRSAQLQKNIFQCITASYIAMYQHHQSLYLSRVSAATLCPQSNLWMNFRIMRRKAVTRNGLVFYAQTTSHSIRSRPTASPLLSNQRPGGVCTWYTHTKWMLLYVWWRWRWRWRRNVNFHQMQHKAGQKAYREQGNATNFMLV